MLGIQSQASDWQRERGAFQAPICHSALRRKAATQWQSLCELSRFPYSTEEGKISTAEKESTGKCNRVGDPVRTYLTPLPSASQPNSLLKQRQRFGFSGSLSQSQTSGLLYVKPWLYQRITVPSQCQRETSVQFLRKQTFHTKTNKKCGASF